MSTARPILFAVVTTAGATILSIAVLWWATLDPESVVIGMPGRHDAPPSGERLADCLDCHVPFVGTPGSRCLGPGCHGELATGTPPKDGKAMPIRFHAALRDAPCTPCHVEHTRSAERVAFSHDRIPAGARAKCSRCHLGAAVEDHARTDSIPCDLCHGVERFAGTEIDHSKVSNHPCDLCHASPKDEAHASVAGACTDCHRSESWKPNDPW
jgi:hypothetical protein